MILLTSVGRAGLGGARAPLNFEGLEGLGLRAMLQTMYKLARCRSLNLTKLEGRPKMP